MTTNPSTYEAFLASGTDVYQIEDFFTSLCWNLDTRFNPARIALDSCANPPDSNTSEEWKIIPIGNAHGDSFIENVALGTHWAVHCCLSTGYIDFTNGVTDGTEYWYWVN